MATSMMRSCLGCHLELPSFVLRRKTVIKDGNSDDRKIGMRRGVWFNERVRL
jgi:hypothetical protein